MFKHDDIITGERLQDLADICLIDTFNKNYKPDRVKYFMYDTTDKTDLDKILSGHIIYTRTELIDKFLEKIYPHFDHPIKIVTHNSDVPVTEKYLKYLNDSQIISWYSQNIKLVHPKLTALPIGIANSMWKHGNIDHLINTINNTLIGKSKDIYVNFRVWTNPTIRKPVEKILKK